MTLTNSERIGKVLEGLRDGLKPFVVGALKGQNPQGLQKDPNFDDVATLLYAMWDHWNSTFRDILPRPVRTLVSELRDIRNKWAHQIHFDFDDTYRALYSVSRLLKEVSASQAQEVDKMKRDLLRDHCGEQAPSINSRVRLSDKLGEMKTLVTLGHPSKRTEFKYCGSIKSGVTLDQTGQPRIDKALFDEALVHFAGQTIKGGFSMTDPPKGGFGEWVQLKSKSLNSRSLTPKHGSFMAASLCKEAGVVNALDGLAVWLKFPPTSV